MKAGRYLLTGCVEDDGAKLLAKLKQHRAWHTDTTDRNCDWMIVTADDTPLFLVAECVKQLPAPSETDMAIAVLFSRYCGNPRDRRVLVKAFPHDQPWPAEAFLVEPDYCIAMDGTIRTLSEVKRGQAGVSENR